ncbi:MAG: hypothetical protein FWD68_08175 [Alphaproteobacteria bacterium]|nr:hypothetical protein [Alphaproteobacteria bacterium]
MRQAGEYGAWFREQVQIGMDAAKAGDVLTSEEMEAEAAVWRAEIQRRMTAGSAI